MAELLRLIARLEAAMRGEDVEFAGQYEHELPDIRRLVEDAHAGKA